MDTATDNIETVVVRDLHRLETTLDHILGVLLGAFTNDDLLFIQNHIVSEAAKAILVAHVHVLTVHWNLSATLSDARGLGPPVSCTRGR